MVPAIDNKAQTAFSKDDLRRFERLTEADPGQFLQIYEESFEQTTGSSDRQILRYYLARAYVSMKRFPEAEAIAIELLNQAVEKGNHVQISQANLILSECYGKSEQSYKQKPCLDVALDAAKQSRNESLIIECLSHLAFYYQSLNDKANAIKHYQRAESISENVDDDIRLKLLIDTGGAYYQFLEYHKAVIYLSSAYKLDIYTRKGK